MTYKKLFDQEFFEKNIFKPINPIRFCATAPSIGLSLAKNVYIRMLAINSIADKHFNEEVLKHTKKELRILLNKSEETTNLVGKEQRIIEGREYAKEFVKFRKNIRDLALKTHKNELLNKFSFLKEKTGSNLTCVQKLGDSLASAYIATALVLIKKDAFSAINTLREVQVRYGHFISMGFFRREFIMPTCVTLLNKLSLVKKEDEERISKVQNHFLQEAEDFKLDKETAEKIFPPHKGTAVKDTKELESIMWGD